MDSVTFFGEVKELSSRAIWWSDSDSDSDEEQLIHNNTDDKEVKVVINTKDDVFKCNTIYISLAKNENIIVKDLTKIGFIDINGINGIIANIFTINETNVWIQLNANYSSLKNHLLVKTISNLMKEILMKSHSYNDENTKPLICIISKGFLSENESNGVIHYLSNNNNNLNIFPKDVKYRALMAPHMLTNCIESSIFEYCIIFEMNCIALILPDFRSFNIKYDFIPNQIITTVQQFNDFSDSNIFI